MALESNKKELVLGTNVFQKPTELVGPKAWAQLVVNLMFLRPGTFPSVPKMGVGIQDYEYEFVDDAVARLNEDINAQVQTYLPDIPVDGIDVRSIEVEGHNVLMVVMRFIDSGSIATAVVAAEVKNKLIDFEISWATN